MSVCVCVRASRPNRWTYGDEIWYGPPPWSGEGHRGCSDRLGRFKTEIKAVEILLSGTRAVRGVPGSNPGGTEFFFFSLFPGQRRVFYGSL